ncbi:MAG TPA: hypothetical protein VFK47_06350, partial [Ktedonobacteraceae bacterium]|nr:hypothetical protein [Ktedonobacteraceae bacterium]
SLSLRLVFMHPWAIRMLMLSLVPQAISEIENAGWNYQKVLDRSIQRPGETEPGAEGWWRNMGLASG